MKTIPAIADVLDDRSVVGSELSRRYTSAIDEWLKSVVVDLDAMPDVALAAVGGYGRSDLAPGSDLDLLLIHDGSGAVAEVAEQIWYPIWDSGMRLGHAVRTIDEALDLAADDLDTATSLLDIRLIDGSARLVDDLAARAQSQWESLIHKMIDRLAAGARERHVVAGEGAFLLEPDLKLSRGGLRDLHTLGWIDRAAEGLLRDSERETLPRFHDVLLSARVELHRCTGGVSNLLTLESQDEVAEVLGYGDADDLMAEVSAAARTVGWIEDAVLHRFHVLGDRPRWRRKVRDFGHGISTVDGALVLAEDAPVETDPMLPLRVALVAARNDAFIARDTLDRLAATSPSLPDPWPDEARDLFVDVLLEGSDAIRPFEALDQVDLVTRFIPEWAPNRSRPQRNAYHRFTVDRHLFEAAAEAAELVDRVARPDLLVVGALFHDIGKGYPGDHSEVGVELVARIATRMGFPPDDIDTLELMVRHHLLLPDVASRRDLEDVGTIRTVADNLGTVGAVELLAALTEADSIATSPSAWNAWKAELVSELAQRTIRFLQDGDPAGADTGVVTPTDEQVALVRDGGQHVAIEGNIITVVTANRAGTFSRVAGALALQGVEILESNLHTDGEVALQEIRVGLGVGLSERPEQVLDTITRAIRREIAITARLKKRARTYQVRRSSTARPARPEVTVDNEISRTATVLEVSGPDSIGFLYRVTRAFLELDLDIVSAKVQTLGDDVIDTFYIRKPSGEKVTEPEFLAEIELAVLSAISPDA